MKQYPSDKDFAVYLMDKGEAVAVPSPPGYPTWHGRPFECYVLPTGTTDNTPSYLFRIAMPNVGFVFAQISHSMLLPAIKLAEQSYSPIQTTAQQTPPTLEERYEYQRQLADQAAARAAVFKADWQRMHNAAQAAQNIMRELINEGVPAFAEKELTKACTIIERAKAGLELVDGGPQG